MLIAAAVLGFIVALANYFLPDNGISGTPGALLVVGSCALLAVTAYAIRRRIRQGRGSGWLLALIALVLIAGTGFAAWLLEAPTLFALMVLAGFSCLMLVLRRRGA